MAFPLVALAIGSLLAGTAAQMKARHDVKSDQEKAYRQYARRTDKRTAEATGIWKGQMAKQAESAGADTIGALAQQKLDRMGDLQESESQYYDPILQGQDRAPTVVKSEIARSLSDELAKARSQIKAEATLEGFSSRAFDRGIDISRANADLGNLGLFAQGDQNIYEYDMNKAAHAGDNWAMVGDVLSALGQIGLLGAGTGLFGAGSKVLSSTGAGVAGASGGAPNLTARLPTIGRVV